MKRALTIGVLIVCVLIGVLVAILLVRKVQSQRVTSQIEHAGGFVGSVQPPPWMNPVYDLVCHIDFFCVPYQLILDGRSASDTVLTLAKELKYLRVLEISEATLTSQQVELLRGMTQLENISLRECIVPEGALDLLENSLPKVEVTTEGERSE
jgi:hypothetical protein